MSVTPEKRPAVLERLETELDQELIERLIAYADKKARWLYWQGMIGAPMPKGLETGDIVSEAMTKVLRGAKVGDGRERRCWDGGGDLYEYLKSVVDSDLNHAAESWANRHFRTESVLAQKSEDDERSEANVLERDSGLPDPEEQLIRREIEQASEEFFWAFREFVEEDLHPILDRIYEGDRKPSEVAESLGWPVEKIYNARKRLRRRLVEFQAHQQDEGGSKNA